MKILSLVGLMMISLFSSQSRAADEIGCTREKAVIDWNGPSSVFYHRSEARSSYRILPDKK